MTYYDDPNRQAVGLAPVWTGAGAVGDVSATEFDPAGHTVAQVLAHIEEHPEERATVLAAEETGKARATLLDALEVGEE